jgi:hypothetical protein
MHPAQSLRKTKRRKWLTDLSRPHGAPAYGGLRLRRNSGAAGRGIAGAFFPWRFPFWRQGLFRRNGPVRVAFLVARLIFFSGLRLAPLQVFPQSRRQPLAARRPFLGFAGFFHDEKSKHRRRGRAMADRPQCRHGRAKHLSRPSRFMGKAVPLASGCPGQARA